MTVPVAKSLYQGCRRDNVSVSSLFVLSTISLVAMKFLVTSSCNHYKTLPFQQLNPHKHVLVFDLHGVLFTFSPSRALLAGLRTDQRLLLVKALCNPWLIKDVITLAWTSNVVEKAIFAITKKYPSLEKIIPTALQMANAQIPIQSMIALLQHLKQQGFRLYIFSNIGEQSLTILQHRYPAIFSLFAGILVTTPRDNYLMKPRRAAFDKLFATFQLTKEQVLFVDDKKKNICAAHRLGIPAILFRNTAAFKKELQKLTPHLK